MKKHLFGLLAIVCAITSVAFTTVTLPNCEAPKKWFKYVGTPFISQASTPSVTLAHLRTPSNYVELDATELDQIANCESTVYLCAICAVPDGSGLPIIDQTTNGLAIYNGLATYFNNAVNTTSIIEKPSL
ncbi:MAG: hypothetical protein ACTHMC_28910 [Pseudobacter sp.]|uniref:hypothetical protein n=1 Tax=Pseudobacter sp. TaxID=2045420 RepID=UPI003F7D07DF